METSLHQQLKQLYAAADGQTEVRLDGYRIDALRGQQLVEIQLGSLSAIRSKVARLLRSHSVCVVKPLIARKSIFKRSSRRAAWGRARLSPKREQWLDLVHQLVYFCDVFPHPRLTIEVPLIEIAEHRLEHTPRRRRRHWKRFSVEDQLLLNVQSTYQLRQGSDLRSLVPEPLPAVFHTGHIAGALSADRWIAQRVAYCWRKVGIVDEVGRQGNARLYQFTDAAVGNADGAGGSTDPMCGMSVVSVLGSGSEVVPRAGEGPSRRRRTRRQAG